MKDWNHTHNLGKNEIEVVDNLLKVSFVKTIKL